MGDACRALLLLLFGSSSFALVFSLSPLLAAPTALLAAPVGAGVEAALSLSQDQRERVGATEGHTQTCSLVVSLMQQQSGSLTVSPASQ